MNKLVSTSVDFGKGFWAEDRKLSGKRIDILRGQNIPGNSKTIDRSVGLEGMISHKSTDIRLRSYQSPSRLYSLGMHYVRQLARYQGEIRMDHQVGATYNLQWLVEMPDCKRILEWFIPDHALSETEEKTLQRIIKDAEALQVEVQIFTVKEH